MSRSRLDGVFDKMIARCEDPASDRWERYGGRGIKICQEWRNDRSKFFSWAIENGYEPGLTIDRINNDGDYEPGNCRFVDAFVQQNNTSRNVSITANGKTMTIAQWARHLGVTYSSIQHRYARGWTPEEIIGTPFRSGFLSKRAEGQ